MHSGIRDHVASCQTCQQPMGAPPGELIAIPPPDHVFKTIRIHHIGIFLKTRKGNSYVLVTADYLSKNIEVQAVPTPSNQHVIDFLNEKFQWRHGSPEKFILDRGTGFTSKRLATLLEQEGVNHHYYSAFHLQTIGLTKRTDHTLMS